MKRFSMRRLHVTGWLVALWLAVSGVAWAGSGVRHPRDRVTLCGAGETVIASCPIGRKVGAKLVSVCLAGETARYRFGRPGRVEIDAGGLRYVFRTATAGGEEQISFHVGAYRYMVYDWMYGLGWDKQGHRMHDFRSGVFIERNGRPIADLVCDDADSLFTGKRHEVLYALPQTGFVDHWYGVKRAPRYSMIGRRIAGGIATRTRGSGDAGRVRKSIRWCSGNDCGMAFL
ncbi:MAG: hypothetical protein KGM17_12705 [Sphingomonadales bacterium]|nr:hypothetical protein [Sphingomonadales bacterium]